MMGQSRRRRARQEATGTFEIDKGRDHYRGHVLRKWRITLAGIDFWRVDIYSVGLDNANPIAMTQAKTTEWTLERCVREAQKVVGWLLSYGAGVPPLNVKEKAYKSATLDSLIMKSSTGKPSICDHHWRQAVNFARDGKISIIVFNMKLMQTWLTKMRKDGLLSNLGLGGYTVNMLLDSYAPICCWLGDDVYMEVLSESKVDKILERAKADNV